MQMVEVLKIVLWYDYGVMEILNSSACPVYLLLWHDHDKMSSCITNDCGEDLNRRCGP